MPRKVLIFSLAYYPHLIGGAEVAIKEITDRIPPGDIEFDMVTLYAGSSRFEKIGNVNVYRVGPRINVPASEIRKISILIKFHYVASAFFKALVLQQKRRYSFTWSMMASFNGFSALFFKWIHKKIPFFLTLQEGDSHEHIMKALGPMSFLYPKIFQRADRIQTISHFLADFGRKMGATCPVDVVPNGVNFASYSQKPTAGQVSVLKGELGIIPSDIILITTSRLVPKNGVSDIIDSLSFLPENYKLLILGNGPQEQFLKNKVTALKLNIRVIFVGFVAHNEIPMYLHISNIFIRPSLSEGFGNSFIEAMAADIPVIATPVGGIVDFLQDKETGLFCEVQNPKSISEKVELLVADKNLRDSIIKKAREMAKDRYDWNLIANEMKGIFDQI